MASVLILASCQQETTEVEIEDNFIAVIVEQVIRQDLFVTHQLNGRVISNNEAFVISPIVAEVKEIFAEEGEWVEKNQVLFRLDDKQIQQQIDQARLAYEAAQANFRMTEEQIRSAQEAFQRVKALYEEGIVSRAQYLQSELAASEKPLEALSKTVAQAELAYRQVRDLLDNTYIQSPMSGRIIQMNIREGQIALNSQAALILMDDQQLVINMGVPESLISSIAIGQNATVRVGELFFDREAKITHIQRTVDPNSNLFPVEIAIENNGDLKIGMSARVELKTDIKEDVISVPGSSVLRRGDERIVFVEQEGIAIERKVETGLDIGTRVEITHGLSEDEWVIIVGQNYVSSGSLVRVTGGR